MAGPVGGSAVVCLGALVFLVIVVIAVVAAAPRKDKFGGASNCPPGYYCESTGTNPFCLGREGCKKCPPAPAGAGDRCAGGSISNPCGADYCEAGAPHCVDGICVSHTSDPPHGAYCGDIGTVYVPSKGTWYCGPGLHCVNPLVGKKHCSK